MTLRSLKLKFHNLVLRNLSVLFFLFFFYYYIVSRVIDILINIQKKFVGARVACTDETFDRYF